MLHRKTVRENGRHVIAIVEDLGLILILVATAVAIGQVVWEMFQNLRVELADLLLIFILLEVITMVDSYWKMGKLPVRIPLYIAMVSMARYLILDTGDAHDIHALYITGAILILAVAVFMLRYGHVKFPYGDDDEAADY
ncbi:MAG TPA: phosphate-starvation-inducible PsiE family protein [Gammaproteobacteria bacterium]|jgi:protein PsiE|nr:phosphate-starvation-inducible PsiE family protein [Gammaproteobacteria bacterium]